MNLRRKLFLAQTPLIVTLLAIAGGALLAAVRFGAAPAAILHENFRSFDAGRSMLHAADNIDQRVSSASLVGNVLAPAALAEPIASFERQLVLQERNITEQGEREATEQLRRAWNAYRAELVRARSTERVALERKRSRELRRAVERILQMNRDAMRKKSERALREAKRISALLTATALVMFLVAGLVSAAWIRRILAPIRVLERGVQRLAAGDFDAQIRCGGSDEIASLSNSFNDMALRLGKYRRSSLGELLDANNRLESVMDSLADAVIVYDLAGAVITRNQAATRLLGESLEFDTLPEGLEDAVREAFDRVRHSGESHEPVSLDAAVELSVPPAPRWLLVSATPVRSRREALAGVSVALRDVTRSRRIEGFKGDLVAAAAHELRTPLTSLHMAVHLCLEQTAGPLTDRQQDLLVTARQDCERLQAVVEELLEMARLESGATLLGRSPLKVAEFMRDAFIRRAPQAEQRGIRLEAVPGDVQLTLWADGSRLERVLDNLLDNAFLHAGDGGRVALGFERYADSVRFTVDDTGPGVPPELKDRVFQKFFRVPGTTKQGSGLGLSIVDDIVRAHGGAVGVDASSLGGARFWFSIPLEPQAPLT